MIEILVICGSFRDRDSFRKRILSNTQSLSPSRYILKNVVGITLGTPTEDFRGQRFDMIMFEDAAITSEELLESISRTLKP